MPFNSCGNACSGSRVKSIAEAELEALAQARKLVTREVAADLHNSRDSFGGLVVIRNAIPQKLLSMMRREAEAMLKTGVFNSTGHEYRDDSVCYLGPEDAVREDRLGISYGLQFISSVLNEINQQRPPKAPLLQAWTSQLACFDNSKVGYSAHKDQRTFSLPLAQILNLFSDESQQARDRLIERRYCTAILYLQEVWKAEWGGSLRAHAEPPSTDYVDVIPEGGTLVIFRSGDLMHEVLPTARRRIALTMWCLL